MILLGKKFQNSTIWSKVVHACLTPVKHNVFLFTSFAKPLNKKPIPIPQTNDSVKLLKYKM